MPPSHASPDGCSPAFSMVAAVLAASIAAPFATASFATTPFAVLAGSGASMAASQAAELESEPASANPYVSFLPAGVEPDMRFWQLEMARRAVERRAQLPVPRGGVSVGETEPNDDSATANLLSAFGTGELDAASVDVAGSFTPPAPPIPLGPFAEDDGALPLASETGLVAGSSVRISGTIGDGPHGSGGTGTGDHDFFRIPGVQRGQLILVDIETALPMDGLDTFIGIYDSAGNIVVLNEDEDPAVTFDSFIAVPAPRDDDYFLSIAGSLFPFAAILADPFDETTGFGVGSEGDYEVEIRLEIGDQDWFAFELEACDILGVNLQGAGDHLLLEDPSGQLTVASSQDLTGAYPASSPLPGGGRAALAIAAPESGLYKLRALGTEGDYTLELRAFRQPNENATEAKILFLDFDGAMIDTSIFPVGSGGPTTLSPLSSFLAGWGLMPSDEDALIDAVIEAFEENAVRDPFAGPNPAFGVEVRNSRDHADPFGQPGVSRLIIGGTIPELGIATIGIAQSIDVGNFESAETGVILLDLLSGSELDANSLNSFPIDPGASKLDFVGISLGNIAAHEAGHFTGAFHTEQVNPLADLMDRGGNLPNTLGVGDDGIYGTADDVDVDFGRDLYNDSEGFAGFESTLAVMSCGCAVDSILFLDGFESGDVTAWSGAFP